MQVSGTYVFDAQREVVWSRLLDPDVLASCIPGCEELKLVGDEKYEATIRVGIGAISGTYSGTVTLSDRDELSSFKLTVEGKGAAGNVRGEGVLDFSDQGTSTEVQVSGDAQVTGLIARVGQRLLGTASKTLMDQFFGCLKTRVEGG